LPLVAAPIQAKEKDYDKINNKKKTVIYLHILFSHLNLGGVNVLDQELQGLRVHTKQGDSVLPTFFKTGKHGVEIWTARR